MCTSDFSKHRQLKLVQYLSYLARVKTFQSMGIPVKKAYLNGVDKDPDLSANHYPFSVTNQFYQHDKIVRQLSLSRFQGMFPNTTGASGRSSTFFQMTVCRDFTLKLFQLKIRNHKLFLTKFTIVLFYMIRSSSTALTRVFTALDYGGPFPERASISFASTTLGHVFTYSTS